MESFQKPTVRLVRYFYHATFTQPFSRTQKNSSESLSKKFLADTNNGSLRWKQDQHDWNVLWEDKHPVGGVLPVSESKQSYKDSDVKMSRWLTRCDSLSTPLFLRVSFPAPTAFSYWPHPSQVGIIHTDECSDNSKSWDTVQELDWEEFTFLSLKL